MRSSFALTIFFLAMRAAADDRSDWYFGNQFRIGPASGDIYIAKTTWSLKTPNVPCGTVTEDANDDPWASIWIGLAQSLSDDGTDLIQPLLNWSPDQEAQFCPGTAEQWCVAASTYTPTLQNQQAYKAVPANAQLDFEVTVESSTKVNQKVYINGELASKQTDTKDIVLPKCVYSGNECYKGTCGTIASYEWSNITIVLSAADEAFGDSLAFENATSTGATTSDNGKTWHINSVGIEENAFYYGVTQSNCSP